MATPFFICLGLDLPALWDCHAHLLGTGDAGSGCWVDARMSQWWHPVAVARRQVILNAACVPPEVASVDRAYVQRLQHLMADFPPGARWLLYAFDEALDDFGRPRPDWTTFHVPNAYAAEVANTQPQRMAWVASIHPHRPDALTRLDDAVAQGAVALKWLPSAMNIDLASPRLNPFYARLAHHGLPLIVHCGEEKAVPGADRDALGNPLKVRAPLQAGVRVIVAHCASLGEALDLDQRRPQARSAFDLFARLMDESDWRDLLLGDISALFQANRSAEVWRTVLARQDWHPRLLHGSDYPLPGVGPLYRPAGLVRAGLLAAEHVEVLDAVRAHNPLLFDLMLKRALRWQGQGLSAAAFATRRHFDKRPKVPPQDT
ncbi:MAG: amidohydrolase [Ideonella sp. MAG2]|nr:MAG: amidohydrolase [Ideonella sp. MAG2]